MRLLLTSALELKRDVSFKRREVGLSSVVTCCAHQPPLKCELVIVGPATPWLPSSNAPTPLAKTSCYDLKIELQFKTFAAVTKAGIFAGGCPQSQSEVKSQEGIC